VSKFIGNSEIAYAKINLALHILARRDDGYHDLDTIFAFLDDGDHIFVKMNDEVTLTVSGRFAETLIGQESNNLIIKAANLLRQQYDVEAGAALLLDKRLPVASGVGGGSADAAATVRLLNHFWGLQKPLEELAELMASLGADIPACIYSRTCRGTGIGTDIEILSNRFVLDNVPALLVNPMISVSTGPVFAAWDGMSMGILDTISFDNIAHNMGNDMERAAISLCPEISLVLRALKDPNPVLSRMSGSGATCFALFDTIQLRDQAKHNINMQYPNWWIMSGELK